VLWLHWVFLIVEERNSDSQINIAANKNKEIGSSLSSLSVLSNLSRLHCIFGALIAFLNCDSRFHDILAYIWAAYRRHRICASVAAPTLLILIAPRDESTCTKMFSEYESVFSDDRCDYFFVPNHFLYYMIFIIYRD